MPLPSLFPVALSQFKVIVNIAFGQPGRYWAAWYQYTDVSDYVLSIHIRRGRQHELDRFEAGTCRIVLDNRDRRFDPFNVLGPYYNNLLPMRRVRVSIGYGSNLYHLFTGFIEAWPQTWPHPGQGLVELEATDGFKVLNLVRLNTSYPQQLSSDRVTAVLDSVGWPAQDRLIHTGQSNLQAVTLSNTAALAHLQEVQLTESGRLFCDGLGRLVFQDRHYPLRLPQTQSQATFGDRPGELPYEGLVVRYDDSQIWNDITIQRLNGASQQVSDTTSIERFFRRALVRERIPLTTDAEAADAATWLLARYKDPVLRVERITLNLRAAPNLPGVVLPREIGDRVTVVRRPPGAGSGALVADYFIEGMEWDISREAVRVTWQLSLASTLQFWVLGDAQLSVLGQTTRLGY